MGESCDLRANQIGQQHIHADQFGPVYERADAASESDVRLEAPEEAHKTVSLAVSALPYGQGGLPSSPVKAATHFSGDKRDQRHDRRKGA
eukprot:1317387-Prymnesium_polylepis.1